VLLALAGALVAAFAGPSAAQREADHDQLRAIARTVKEAVNAGRLDDLTPLLAKGFSITMVDQTLVTDPAQLKEYFQRYFQAPDSPLQSVRIDPPPAPPPQSLDHLTPLTHATS